MNTFEELQEKKAKLTNMAVVACEYGWIDDKRKQDIIDKLNNDVLTIGVIGQMKCGKSTFLNSFVFEDTILPSATTPMTAALSVITYGEEKKIVAEFYNLEEWEEQKYQANRSLEEVAGNVLLESKIKAAKELVGKSVALGTDINQYLGRTQEDTFENLVEYVGADGKYVSITKSVTIYYPKEYLKGVEIVDTPGFNDPIVSREERTKEFLKKADVVLLMLYAGRPFDATDREILFKNVRQCGTGKVLVGINKYDIPYENGETEKEIAEYVKEEIRKASKICDDSTMTEILGHTEPIPLSAEMALLSQLPLARITSDESLSFSYKRVQDIFEVSSQSELLEKSHFVDLTETVKQLIAKEKEQILFAKPANAIIAAGKKKLSDIEDELERTIELIQNLNTPDSDLEEKLDNLSRAKRKLDRKIDSLGDDIDYELKQICRTGKNTLEDCVDSAAKKMRSIVEDDFKLMTNVETVFPKLDQVKQELVTRTLKREVEGLGFEAENKMRRAINEFFGESEEIFMKYYPDFNSHDFVKRTSNEVEMAINGNMFAFDYSDDEDDITFMGVVGDLVENFLKGYTFGGYVLVKNAVTHNAQKNSLLQYINSLASDFDPTPFLDSVFDKKEKVISQIRSKFIDELITPLEKQIEEIVSKNTEKETNLQEATARKAQLEADKKNVEQQINEMIKND